MIQVTNIKAVAIWKLTNAEFNSIYTLKLKYFSKRSATQLTIFFYKFTQLYNFSKSINIFFYKSSRNISQKSIISVTLSEIF